MGNIIQNCNDGGVEVSKRLASLKRRASGNSMLRRSTPTLHTGMGPTTIGASSGGKIPYAQPFLLRVVFPPRLSEVGDGEEYLYASQTDGKEFQWCSGPVVQSSIVTFHGPSGQQWNYTGHSATRSSGLLAEEFGSPFDELDEGTENDSNSANGAHRPLRYVQEGDVVTIFANIRDGGRYLALDGGRHLAMVSRTSSKFERAQFIVRKSDASPESSSFNLRSMFMNDKITLESVARPGFFLSAGSSNGAIYLSSFDMGTFEVRAPELRHLVKLNGTSGAKFNRKSRGRSINRHSKGSSLRDPSSPRSDGSSTSRVSKARRLLTKKENEWLGLMARLPLDVVFLVMSFKGRWVTTARLVCYDWCRTAELHVRRIRVNGEFACISTQQQRLALLDFVKRCQNVESVTLRNLDDLSDSDFQHLLGCNPNMKKLVVGGCRRLSDGSINTIAQLRTLQHLNLAATNITDEALGVVASELDSLTCLNLYACRNITSKGLTKVASMGSLESVNVRGTKLNKTVTDQVQRQRPKLQVLTGELLQDGIY